jgi:carboxypeptidase C (cathepsin A)
VTEAYGRIARVLGLGACLLLPASLAPAPAEDAPPSPPTEVKGASAPSGQEPQVQTKADHGAAPDLLPPTSLTHHTITLSGETIHYAATAGTLPVRDPQGKTMASIFYVAYAREPGDTNTKRPITFVFNGGPGAASAYLHLGALGPKAIDVSAKGEVLGPPSRLVDNNSSWLDFTDLIFVDPVGTGYSRASDGKDEHDFFSIEHDTEYLADFIRTYLIDNARMSSPVFLTGESYGGFRAATITRDLQKKGGVSPSGLVLISPALEFALLNGEDYDPLSWALALPSYVAVNLESKGVTGREALAAALKDAERYALSDYLIDLASGMDEGGRLASGKVAELTGLPVETVERHFARIEPALFIKEFDRSHGQVMSRYDGSVGGPDPNPSSSWPRSPDPVLDSTVPLWTAAFIQYAQDELAYKTEATYRLLNRDVRSKWDFGTSPTRQGYAGVINDIQDARAANRSLGVLIAAGYTDLITPYLSSSYLVNQLPPLQGAAPIRVKDYAGGHMLYLRPDSRRALKEDAEAMYEKVLKSSPQG